MRTTTVEDESPASDETAGQARKAGVVRPSNSLFDQPWWLDAVAPGAWDEVSILDGNAVVARWPFVRRPFFGFRCLIMPPMTPMLGPCLAPIEGKYVTRLSRETHLLSKIIDALPSFSYLSCRLHPSLGNWLPFYWDGWSQTTRYTYVLDDLSSEDRLWAGLRQNIRTDIKKAARQVEVRTDAAIDDILRLQQLTFRRQGRDGRHLASALRRVIDACTKRNAGRAFSAVSEGRIHAVAYIVWDERSAFYITGGGDPELRGSGAHSLVLWEAIRFAGSVTQSFDFEGSMNQRIERFFRAFGARQTPYSHLRKINSRVLGTARAARELIR